MPMLMCLLGFLYFSSEFSMKTKGINLCMFDHELISLFANLTLMSSSPLGSYRVS